FAADQFVITPAGRFEEAARAHAAGDEVRTVIAGYHWFTDWGRDTMISLEGLTLITGRWLEAGYILRTFAHYVRDGLIPNMFPDGAKQGTYHTADATLWFFHALARYLDLTKDHNTLKQLLPGLIDIVEHHLRGTKFNIHVDPNDWKQVIDIVEDKLVTPLGLRTLSPDDPEYKPIYSGDLRSRDGAYHQGTVWAWLIGPFIDAWLKVHPHDQSAARKFLERFPEHLSEAGIG